MPTINDKVNMESVLHEVRLKNIGESSEFLRQDNIPKMSGVKGTAEIFGISQNYARQLALSGAVKAVRIGRGKILINVQSLSEFFNSSYINAPEPVQTSEIKPISVNL